MKIFVKVKTRAKLEKIEKIGENNFVISVKAVPHEGQANQALIKALAEYFEVAQADIQFISGHKSKQKIFDVVR